MKVAATALADELLTIEERPEPEPGPGELVVGVAACGICGSDLHLSQLGIPGIVLGHELAGDVLAVGEGVEDFAEGDRVCAFPLVGCGRCPACEAGRPAHCTVGGELIGLQRPGGFAEAVATSAKDTFLLPGGLDHRTGALVEPLAVALHAVEGARREVDEPALVIGAGPVGLAIVLWLRHLGARHIVVSDPVAGRRAMAERLGATATVDPTAADVRSAFERETGAAPTAVLECVGVPGTLQHAADVAGAEALVTVVGVCMQPDTVTPLVALSKELTMRFVLYYLRADFERTLAALAGEAFDPTVLITDDIGLDDLPARFEALRRPTTEGKVLVRP
jgi:(R,R)-butanediol dehydrogenase/meso-butanediol dehydrogenase/diacetyl reductase